MKSNLVVEQRVRNRRQHAVTRAVWSLFEQLETRTLFGFYAAGPNDETPAPTGPGVDCDGTTTPATDENDGGSEAANSGEPVRYFDGVPIETSVDLDSKAFGFEWGLTRQWTGLNNASSVGNGWSISELPYIVVAGGATGTANGAGTPNPNNAYDGVLYGTAQDHRLSLVSGKGTLTFDVDVPSDYQNGSYATYAAWSAQRNTLEWDQASSLIRLTDAEGNITEFFDVRRASDASDPGDPYHSIQTSDPNRPIPTSRAEYPSAKYGQFARYISANGTTQVRAEYDSDGNIRAVTRADYDASGNIISSDVERYQYDYTGDTGFSVLTNDLVTAASDTPPKMIARASLLRSEDGGDSWSTVRYVDYTYYTGRVSDGNGGYIDDQNGRLGDLKLAEVKDSHGTIDTKYYRYYKFTGEGMESSASQGATNNQATTGGPFPVGFTPHAGAYGDIEDYDANDPGYHHVFVQSGLKSIVEGASFARLAANYPNYEAATDEQLKVFSDHFFIYERWADHVGTSSNGNVNFDWRIGYRLGSRYRVVQELAQGTGCSTCSGGQGTYRLDYTPNNSNDNGSIGYNQLDYNVWRMRTTEYLPDTTNTKDSRSLGGGDLTSSGSLATVYWPDHGFQVGEQITVTGSTDAAYNGTFTITKILSTTEFQYRLASTASTGTPGGSIVVTNNARIAAADWQDNDLNIVYTNELGLPLLKVVVDRNGTSSTADDKVYATYYRYDDQGRLILTANPSAVAAYDPSSPYAFEQYSDLAGWNGTEFANLKDSDGLIEVRTYGTSTTASASAAGDVSGYLKTIAIEHGDQSSTILKATQAYYAHTYNGASVYPIAWTRQYRSDTTNINDSSRQETSYAYTWLADGLSDETNQIASITTTLPIVTEAQNGPGTADQSVVVFDQYGQAVWTKDADGYLTYMAYDTGTGAEIERIVDAPSTVSGASVASPGRGSGLPTALPLTTTREVDALGRSTEITEPNGNITYIVHNDVEHEERVYRGWHLDDHGTPGDPSDDFWTTTGPIEISREYRPSAGAPAGERTVYTESLTLAATPTTSNGKPTGAEAIATSDIRSLQRSITNNANQVIDVDAYFSLADVSYATASAVLSAAIVSNDSAAGNYHRTQTDYDGRGRVKRVVTPSGTVQRFVYDARGLLVQAWIGTDDEPTSGFWSPTNNTGANMTLVESRTYDNGAAGGDGNLTQVTAYPDGVIDDQAGNTVADRVTTLSYDWRDRLVATKSGTQSSESGSVQRVLDYLTYDNLGQVTSDTAYDADGVSLTDANSDGTPDVPSSSNRRALTNYYYDEQGRLYRTTTYSVDGSNGALSSSTLESDRWYDRRGNAVKQTAPGQPTLKQTFDGAGRVLNRFISDGGSDAAPGATNNWQDALTVSGDIVLEQNEQVYDNTGNVLMTVAKSRFHNATGTGELGDANSTSQPKARVSYAIYYYDLADRQTAAVNIGTNGGSAYSRPSTVPARSDIALVTSYGYDDAGRISSVVNPRGVESRSFYDLLGRTTKTIEAYSDGAPSDSDDRTTEQTYDGSGHVLTQKAVLPGGAFQVTQYVYGVSTGTGSSLNSNEILGAIRYPDLSTGSASTSNQELFSVNAIGEQISSTDRNGSTHTYTYDVLGRMTSDIVTTLGTNVDGYVRRIDYTYNSQGLPERITSYGDTSGSTVRNEVLREYNGLGQLVREYQNHSGAIISGNKASTPVVQYAYSEMSGGANHSRLTSITYPNGRAITYDYTSGVDSTISRLSAIKEGSTTLEAYSYLGLSTFVNLDRGTTQLSYITSSTGDAGDIYGGLDRFGRVVNQNWTSSATTTDDFEYTYDRNGNRTRRNVDVSTAPTSGADQVDEYYAYDKLDRLIEQRRGTFDASNQMSSATFLSAWNLDAIGNVTGYVTVNDPTMGDTNLDGWVDYSDLLAQAHNYNAGYGAWRQGDFNADGAVDFSDLLALAQAYDDAHANPQGNVATTDVRTYNAQNELTGLSGSSLTNDAAGNNTVDQDGLTHVFDAWGREVEVKNGSTSVIRYAYDGTGRRITDGDAEQYFNDQGQVLEVRNGSGTVTTQYVWSPVYIDALVIRDQDLNGDGDMLDVNERLMVQWDANFDVTSVTDTSGNVVERYRYEAYGDRVVLNSDWTPDTLAGSDSTTADDAIAGWNTSDVLFRQGHQGGTMDRAVAGKVFFRNRTLDVKQMRWTQQDPNPRGRYVDGMNSYAYVRSNPSRWMDPFGMEAASTTTAVQSEQEPSLGWTLGIANWLYTGNFYATDDEYNAATDAAGQWMYDCSPVRGASISIGAQAGDNHGPVNIGGNAWGGWTMDEGAMGGAEITPGVPIRDNGVYGGVGGYYSQDNGWDWYGLGGGSIDGAYAQGGRAGYGELGIGADWGPAHIGVGLLLDYNRMDLTDPWWNKDDCDCANAAD